MSIPQDRYDLELSIKTLSDGRVVFRPSRPRVIPTDIQDLTVTVGPEDRMDIIANNIFGNALDWWKLASVNGFRGSLHFTPGKTITIPRNS